MDQNELQPNNMVTSYLIRFTPAQSFSLLEFDVYIQPGVDKVELNIASPIDALSARTFLHRALSSRSIARERLVLSGAETEVAFQ